MLPTAQNGSVLCRETAIVWKGRRTAAWDGLTDTYGRTDTCFGLNQCIKDYYYYYYVAAQLVDALRYKP